MKLSSKVFIAAILALMLACFVSACTVTTYIKDTDTDNTPTESSSESNSAESAEADDPDGGHVCVDNDPTDGKCDGCGQLVKCAGCVDEDPKDAKCDVCGKVVPCKTCEDVNPKNGKCDVCGKTIVCEVCVDEEGGVHDATCDVCGSTVSYETVDASFEEIANEHINNATELGFKENVLATGNMDMGYLSIPLFLKSGVATIQDASGNLFYSNYQQVYMNSSSLWAFTENDMTPLVLSNYANTLIHRPTSGADIYMMSELQTINYESGDMDTERYYIYVPANAEELERHQDAGNPLVAEHPTELFYSVNDFMAVNQREGDEGNGLTTYQCFKLRPERIEYYNEILGNLGDIVEGYSYNAQIDPDSMTYSITVDENGRAISCMLGMTLSVDMDGLEVEFTCYADYEFDYEVDDIEVPESAYDADTDTWNNEDWVAYTMDEALSYVAGNWCEGECVDANHNGICDVCAWELVDVLPCAFTHKDEEPDGVCDDCGYEIS